MIRFVFNEEKATQVAAYFLKQNDGTGTMMYLLKLIYIADRAAMRRWGAPISTDMAVSMEHGPVLTKIYDLMKTSIDGYWGTYIKKKNSRKLRLVDTPDFEELSLREERLINEVYGEYGHLPASKLREITHRFPEWEDPGSSSRNIDYEKLLSDLGLTSNTINEIEALEKEKESINSLLRV